MPGVKISALTAVPSCALTDIFPEVQPAVGGTTYKATFAQLMTLFQGNLVTPANGGIVYTNATSLQVLAPTATANQVLMSGANSAPHWSTPTYPTASGTAGKLIRSDGTNNAYTTLTFPDNVAQNVIFFANVANNLGPITPAASSALISSAGSVPSWSTVLPALTTADPLVAQGLATKAYVDATASGITVQGACRLATTTALTVTYNNVAVSPSGVGATLTNAGAQVALNIDGTAAVVNDRILVKNQASALQNGIYTVTDIGSGATNWIMTRATDYDQPAEVNPGDLVIITAGSTLASSSWIETATVTSIGVDSISFSQFSAALPITVPNGGTGLTTMTAYALLAGGTTATGNLQQVTALGASGTILTSNGAGALPTFQAAAAGGFATVAQQIFTATGTYTPTASMKYCIIEVVGGGGGGGGVTGAVGQGAYGSGGDAGGYSKGVFSAASIVGTAAITIGAAGAAGAAGANNGTAGGTTTVIANAGAGATLLQATGGGFGHGDTATATAHSVDPSAAPGIGTNGSLNVQGGAGYASITLATGAGGMAGAGGSSVYGGGGSPNATTGAGVNGGVYGAGGSGASSVSNALDRAGGAGAPGVVYITEFI